MQHVRASVVSPRAFDAELKGKRGLTRLHEVTGIAAGDPVMIVQSTFALLAKERPRFGQRFYENFFALALDIRTLFATTTPEVQDRMFVEMLFLVVRSLSRMNEWMPALAELGARHLAYGTNEAHFAAAKRALMQTLDEMLGEAMTAEATAAWSSTYDAMVTSMLRGMQAERARAS